MRHRHRHPRGVRSRRQTRPGHWDVRARVERFVEPSLLLLLRERPLHGYELIERLPEVAGEGRVDVGNLYRLLRALEAESLVSSEWSAELPGPAKRRPTSRAFSTATTRTRGGEQMHGRRHHRHGGCHRGRRFPDAETLLRRLEEYQRDLEQETADVADLIRRLKEGKTETETATV